MQEDRKIGTTEILEDVVKKTPSDILSDKILIKDLIEAMDAGGFGLVIMIFALPILIPLPPPFPTLISVPLVIFSFQMMIGYPSPKLPKRFSKMSVKRSVLAMMVEKSAPYFKKADRLLKPRMLFLSQGVAERVVGFFVFIFAMSVFLPLPLSNYIPGIGILITSFGLIGRDGLVVLIGMITGLIGIAITTIAVIFGVEAIYMIKNIITNLF